MSPSRITASLRRLLGLTASSPIKKASASSRNTNRARLGMEVMEDRTVPALIEFYGAYGHYGYIGYNDSAVNPALASQTVAITDLLMTDGTNTLTEADVTSGGVLLSNGVYSGMDFWANESGYSVHVYGSATSIDIDVPSFSIKLYDDLPLTLITPQVSVTAPANATEGGSDGAFLFTRTGDVSSSLTVNYTVVGGTASGSDYTSIGTSVTFLAGHSTADVVVHATNDTTGEPTESVILTLGSGSGYIPSSPNSATVNILDNDPLPLISVTKNADAVEGGEYGSFLFTRTGDSSQPLTLHFTISTTGTSGTDFMAISGTLDLLAGETSHTLSVIALPDNVFDPGESVTLTLNSVTGYGYDVGTNNSATVNIEDVPPGDVSGAVWVDADEDGIKDSGESWLAGVTVAILDANGDPATDADGNTLSAVTTGSNGEYSFVDLYPRGYTLQFTVPTGYVVGGLGTVRAETVAINSDETVTLDLPAYSDTQISSVSGVIRAYPDSNDSEAPGLSGVTVELLDANGDPAEDADGNPVASVLTDSNGEYAFANLGSDSYTVLFTAPSGYLFFESDQSTLEVEVSTPGPNQFANAEAYQPASVSGVAWVDDDQDGVIDTGESPLAGVTVDFLTYDGWEAVANTVTGIDGSYAIANLAPGTYWIIYTAPTGYFLDGDSDTLFQVLTVGTGQAVTQNIATFTDSQLSTISGRVWIDTDGSGFQDVGETGLFGVGVAVYDSDNNLVDSATTDANGDYSITGLTPGAYRVEFTSASGYLLSESRASSWSTDVSTPGPDAIIIAGAYQPASVSGTVWVDTDDDGVVDAGESAIDGAIIAVYGSNGKIVATTTADADGEFSIGNLPPDVYRLGVDAPVGYALNGMDPSVWVPLTLTSGESETVPVAYNKAEADDVTITPQPVAGKELFDVMVKEGKTNKKAKESHDTIKERLGIDVTAAADQTKWAKEKLMYGVVTNGGKVVSGGAFNGVRFKVENFNKAKQKDKAMIIQKFTTEIKLFDADGKQIGGALTIYGIEGFNVDANGVMNGVDLHSYNALVNTVVNGKTVASVKAVTDAEIAWGIYDGKAPPQGGIFYYSTKSMPEKDPVTWLGKVYEYQSKYELEAAGTWFFVDDSAKNRAEGTGNMINPK